MNGVDKSLSKYMLCLSLAPAELMIVDDAGAILKCWHPAAGQLTFWGHRLTLIFDFNVIVLVLVYGGIHFDVILLRRVIYLGIHVW